MDLFGIASNVECLLGKSRAKWRMELTTHERRLDNIEIRRRSSLHKDCLSPLIFILCIILLILTLSKVIAGYVFKSCLQKVNHLLFVDEFKHFAKNESQGSSLFDIVNIFIAVIGNIRPRV